MMVHRLNGLRLKVLTFTLLALGAGFGSELLHADAVQKATAATAEVTSHTSELIPRETLFSTPKNIRPRLSPDGSRIVYMAHYGGALRLWVRQVGAKEAKPIALNSTLVLRQNHKFYWALNNEQILLLVDNNGDEHWRAYAVSIANGDVLDLTPIEGANARIFALEEKYSNTILVSLNEDNQPFSNVYRIDLRSGERELLIKNDLNAVVFKSDHQYRVRIALTMTPTGELSLLHRTDSRSLWQELARFPADDALSLMIQQIGHGPENMDLIFSADDQMLYAPISFGGNTVRVLAFDTTAGSHEVIFEDPSADVSDVALSPISGQIQAVAVNRARLEWTVLDPNLQSDFHALSAVNSGDLSIVDRNASDSRWLVSFVQDRGPVAYYLFDRSTQLSTFLFYDDPELADLPLIEMRPVSYQAWDGLTIPAYLLLPAGVDSRQLPLVVLPHGGPMWRVSWGYSAEAQWLANRGYAVLLPNFRASTGYGKKFTQAGNREWGGKIQDDITDGVNWLVEQGLVDPKRVCIMGSSFGGYSALMSIAKEPDLYACSVAVVPPPDLIQFRTTLAPYYAVFGGFLDGYIGHPVQDAERLQSFSPTYLVDHIKTPVLLVNGAMDDRVPRKLVLQFRDALRAAGGTVEQLEFADEGHSFSRAENRLKFYRKTEKFLSDHLGGRYE